MKQTEKEGKTCQRPYSKPNQKSSIYLHSKNRKTIKVTKTLFSTYKALILGVRLIFEQWEKVEQGRSCKGRKSWILQNEWAKKKKNGIKM